MANAIILGAPRYELNALAAGTTAASGMPVTNLETDEPSELCRLETTNPGLTFFKWGAALSDAELATSFDTSAVGLINHNLSRDAQVRLVLHSSTAIASLEVLAPTSLESSTNFTGGFADVDDSPFAEDANNMTTTTPGTPSEALFGFATPANTPRTGADLQSFYILVAGSGVGSGAVDVELYESGGLVANLIDDQVITSNGTDTLLVAHWNASSLGTASGANVEVRVNNHTPDALFGLTIRAVSWVSEPADPATLTYDSGWVDAVSDSIDTYWGDTAPSSAGRAPTENFVHVLSSMTDAAFGALYIRDPENSSGYVQAGVLVVGPAFQPALNRAYGPLVGIEDLTVKKRTHGGGTYGVGRPRLRRVHFPHAALSAAEAHSLFERLYWRRGILRPVLVSLFPGDATEGKNTTIWCTPDSFEDMQAPDPSGYRTLAITFTEKL